MVKVHENVRHPKFGTGTVLEVNTQTALVEWDTHRVVREFDRPGRTPLKKHHSHVNLNKLSVIK
ncbi:MAG TPA: hypothetical protein VK324_09130 [Tepidisphaeraceae bacterium]|nr:hypothetical protein [Tepidisphaeraceae bacterium]